MATSEYPEDESPRHHTNKQLPPIDDQLVLNKAKFNRTVKLLAVAVPCNKTMRATCEKLREYFPTFIRLPKLNHTYIDPSGVRRKLLLLQPQTSVAHPAFIKNLNDLNIDVSLSDVSIESQTSKVHIPENVPTDGDSPGGISLDKLSGIASPGLVNVCVGYDNFSLEQVLKEVLPEQVAPITGFTVMGHVAHFNLNPDALPYRHVIGQVVMDKISHVRTVVHKAAQITSDYRTFQLDLMAGEPDYVTTVRENGLRFQLDISKVYWNSRLSTEHTRIVEKIKSFIKPHTTGMNGEHIVVYDVFAGVGPFAVPLARLGCRVFANDLNPDSYKWLLKNVELNKSRRRPLENITCYNLDGREFIRKVVLPHYWQYVDSVTSDNPAGDGRSNAMRFIVLMNLPMLAPDFLDAFLHPQTADEILFPGSQESKLEESVEPPTKVSCTAPSATSSPHFVPLELYCYCFLRRNLESEQTVKDRIGNALETNHTSLFTPNRAAPVCECHVDEWNLRFVRNVAPYKDMYCAEFNLTLPQPELVNSEFTKAFNQST